jgi:hypothetical protein
MVGQLGLRCCVLARAQGVRRGIVKQQVSGPEPRVCEVASPIPVHFRKGLG